MNHLATQVVMALLWIFVVMLGIFVVSLMAIIAWGTIAFGLEILTGINVLDDSQFARIEQLIGRLWSYVLTAIAFARLSSDTFKGAWNRMREWSDSRQKDTDAHDG